MRLIQIILLFVLLNVNIQIIKCGIDAPTPIDSQFTKNSIVYIYHENETYWSSWDIIQTDTILNFDCSTNNFNRTCNAIVNDELADKLNVNNAKYTATDPKSGVSSKTLIEDIYFPTPIVEPEFRPPTKGGNVIINGYYLSWGFLPPFKILPSGKLRVVDDSAPTKTMVDYPSGCGIQTFQWANGKTYNFSYKSPFINDISINGSTMLIIGSNFCNISNQIVVSIDGKQVEQSNVLSVDHETIKLNYTQKYSTKITVKVTSGGSVSNEKIYSFLPTPISINSIPKSKGGSITIIGERLTSSNSNTTINVKIGNSLCSHIDSTTNQITCDLSKENTLSEPLSKDLPVLISINGLESSNSLLFSFDTPKINRYVTQKNGILNLYGDCFGDISKTLVYLGGNKANLNNLTISDNEKEMTFPLSKSILKVNVSISVNGISSNTVLVDNTFSAKFESNPSVKGQSVSCLLSNIDPINFKTTPYITLSGSDIRISGVSTNPNYSNETERVYTFVIPSGCGKKDIDVSMGTQSCQSIFSYQSPIVSNCSITGSYNDTVVCNGDFNNYLSDYSDKLKLKFSNSTFNQNDLSKFTNDQIVFPLDSKYSSDQLIIEMCDIEVYSYSVTITPIINTDKPIIENQLNSTGGIISIIGKFFKSETSSNTYLKCYRNNTANNDTTTLEALPKHNCSLINTELIKCRINEVGPFDLNCLLVFNGQNNRITTFTYHPPIVSNYSISINNHPKSLMGVITILGSEFYDLIDSITVGKEPCSNANFINSTSITCEFKLPSLNQMSNKLLLLDPTATTISQYINVTINGKSGGQYFIFNPSEFENSDGSSIGDGNNTNKDNDDDEKLSIWWISLLVVGVVLIIGGVIIYKIFLHRKFLNYLRKRRIYKKNDKNDLILIDQVKKNQDRANEILKQYGITPGEAIEYNIFTPGEDTIYNMDIALQIPISNPTSPTLDSNSTNPNQEQSIENNVVNQNQLDPQPITEEDNNNNNESIENSNDDNNNNNNNNNNTNDNDI